MVRESAGDGVPRLDPWRLRRRLWLCSRIDTEIMGGGFPCPDLWTIRSGLRRRVPANRRIIGDRLPCFYLLHFLCRLRTCSRICAKITDGGFSCPDPRALRSSLRCRFPSNGGIMNGGLPCPDLGQLCPIPCSQRRIRMGIPDSGFPYLDPLPLRSGRGGGFCPASRRRRRAALPDGDSLPCLDSRRVLWGQFCRRLLNCGKICQRERVPVRYPGLAPFPLFQQGRYPALCPPRSADSGVLYPVAAVVIGLPALGGIPELAPQALRPIVQPTADEFLGRGFDLLFQAFLCFAFFLDFFDISSPPERETGPRQRPRSIGSMQSRHYLRCQIILWSSAYRAGSSENCP